MAHVFRKETPIEYFKEMVEGAIDHQRVRADPLTAYYLVNLLCGFIHLDGRHRDAVSMSEPFAARLGRALESGGSAKRELLRRLGDASLFVSGFFGDSFQRKIVDIDYYMTLGGYAYSSLSREESESLSIVFAELAEKFGEFVDVLSEVSERSGLLSNSDLLRLYEKWLRTGSRRNGQMLVERGIVPNASIANRFMQ